MPRQRRTRTTTAPKTRLSKSRVIELLESLNVNHEGVNKFKDLKTLLYNQLPNYSGKKNFTDISDYVENQILPERIQNIADDLDIFNDYQPPEQLTRLTPTALMNKDRIMRQINDYQDFDVDFAQSDISTQEAYLMGLIESLKSLKLKNNNKYLILRLKFGDGKECMRIINAQTINHLLHLIAVLEGKASDDAQDYTDSDQAVLLGFLSLTGFALEWYDYKKINKAFGYFPYYNTIKELDLSPFGIYHNDEEANYNDNCFILAAIQSKLFSSDEIDLMRSMINTRYIPRDDVKFIAETLNVQIDTYYFNEERKKIDKAVRFNKGAERVLRLLIRCGHGMLYHDELVPQNKYDVHNLNTLITRMIDNDELVLIKDVSNAEKFMTYSFDYDNLEYPQCSVKPFMNKNKSINYNLVFAAIFDKSNNSFIYKHGQESKTILYYELFNAYPDKTLIYVPTLQHLNDIFTDTQQSIPSTSN